MSCADEDAFSDPSADVLVWSSDGVAFKLHRVILSLASNYFKDLFDPCRKSLPTNAITRLRMDSSTSKVTLGGHPEYHLEESGEVLDALFRLCYPVDDPSLESLQEVRSTLEVAKKYQMREALKITKRRLLAFAATEPTRVYAIAYQLGLEDIAQEAAKETLKQQAQYTYVEELEAVPASAYQRLLTFCNNSGDPSSLPIIHRGPLPASPTPHTVSKARSQGVSSSLMRTRPLSTLSPSWLKRSSFTPKIAPYPFNVRDAEIVLSSSDSMEFRVYKTIIDLASPVLASRLAGIPMAPAERRFSMPAPVRRLSLPECSQVITILLKICYPGHESLPSDVHILHLALLAAKEYQMQKAVRVLQETLTARKVDTTVAPELLYAIACRCELPELAAAAAKRTLRAPYTDSTFATFDKYALSAACVQRLLAYQRRCRDAARHVVGRGWRTQLESSCRLGKWASSDGQTPCWYERYMSAIAEDPWPTAATATNPELVRSAVTACRESRADGKGKGKGCRYCTDRAHLLVYYDFTRYVAETIEALENKVVLEWPNKAAQ
ncbi:hypothetical protein C8Q80DRAFT_244269 [Daedaleopsis nitida]|nr:hypothetical protein C8Q80DRAFT_244269 [Daedaleopsis nitida]